MQSNDLPALRSKLGSAFSSPVSRRTLLKAGLGGAALAGTGLLAACAPTSSGAASSDGVTTVRMWSWYTGQKDELPKVIAAFEAKNPKIKIDNRIFGSPDQYLPALQAAVSGGDVPEIFAPHTRAITYGQQGISLDLKKELGDSFLSDFFDSSNQEYTDADGHQWAVGYQAQTFGIFYNPQIFADLGISGEPETWDDLIDVAKTVNAAGKSAVAVSCNPGTSALDFFLPLITQVTDDPTYFLKLDTLEKGASWDSQPVKDALALNKKIVDANVFQPGTTSTSGDQAVQLFYTGGAAMLFNGSWTPQTLVQSAPADFVKSYKVMQTPALASGKKHWTANQAGAGWSVTDNAAKDASLEFLKFMYEADQYSPTMNNSNSMPATKSAAAKISDPTMKLMTSWLTDGNGCPHIPFGQGTTAVSDPLSTIFGGTGDPDQVAKDMQAAVKNAQG